MALKTVAVSGAWSNTATWGGSLPVDGDAITIPDGRSLLCDVDLSTWTGLQNVIITGGVTPGKLYFANGTNGYLKIRTGYSLSGTTDTNRGQLVANSDGDFATATELQYSNKATIALIGTAQIDASNLDINLRCAQPVNKMVHTYGTKYEINASTTVNPSTDVIDLGTTPPAAGTAVTIVPLSGATLPTGLYEDEIFFVRSVSGNTCKLAHQNNDTTIADITAVGSGTIAILTGYNSGSATVNVLEDVTGDLWAVGDYAASVDSAPENYDQQRVTLSGITATTITLSATVDSAQFPGARIGLASRNVAITSTCTTAVNIVDFKTSSLSGMVFQCGILSLGGSGTAFYGNGLYSSNNNTISGSVFGCSNGLNSSNNNTISGSVFGCSNGLYSSSNNTISGSVFGCSNGLYSSSNNNTISGSVFGCSYGLYSSNNNTISGSVFGCSYDFRFPANETILLSGAQSTFTLTNRNVVGIAGRISCENYNGVNGAYKSIDAFGDILKTACNGVSDSPSVDPDGGSEYCVEASSIQSNCDTLNYLSIISRHRLWLTSGSHTITYKLQSTFANIPAGRLKLTVNYISGDSPLTNADATHSPEITTRSNAADWSQTLSVSITTALEGWVDCKIDLMHYEAGAEVYIWPVPVVS